jgi:hypothetical protein
MKVIILEDKGVEEILIIYSPDAPEMIQRVANLIQILTDISKGCSPYFNPKLTAAEVHDTIFQKLGLEDITHHITDTK